MLRLSLLAVAAAGARLELTRVSTPRTIDVDGTVLENYNFTVPFDAPQPVLTIRASNVSLRNVLVSHPKGGDGIVTVGEAAYFTTHNVMITRHPEPCYYMSTLVWGGPECDNDTGSAKAGDAWGEDSLGRRWLRGSEASGGPGGVQPGELHTAA